MLPNDKAENTISAPTENVIKWGVTYDTSHNGESFSDGTVTVVASIYASNNKKKVIDKQGVLLEANVEGKYRVERRKPQANNIIPISKNINMDLQKLLKNNV